MSRSSDLEKVTEAFAKVRQREAEVGRALLNAVRMGWSPRELAKVGNLSLRKTNRLLREAGHREGQ